MTNIAEILKNCPKGTKLYSTICGECEFKEVYDTIIGITYCSATNNFVKKELLLDEYGRLVIEGDCIIFPSKDCRDWSAFGQPKYLEPDDTVVRDVQAIVDLVKNQTQTTKANDCVDDIVKSQTYRK